MAENHERSAAEASVRSTYDVAPQLGSEPRRFPEVMDSETLAEYLNISPQTARVWVSRRMIPFTKANRRTLFLKVQIDRWLERNSVKPL